MPASKYLVTALFLLALINSASALLIVDHTAVDEFDNIPASWIEKAKQDFRVSYGHTSHGSQIVSGMTLLENDASYSDLFSFYDDYHGSLPADNLSFWDRKMSGASDLGNPNRTAWATATRNHLDNVGSNRNLIMWSWCGQVSNATDAQIANDYLANMEQLETDYPNVTFIYMTGHLNGSGPSGNLYQRNNQIREYCQNNDKILFDFADIESWDPAGNYYPDERDSCGWCSTWCSSHECLSCSCAHSHCFNCYLKGKAFWWMMARIAGWEGAGCADGQTQACPLQSGVCSGSEETCTGGAWPGCDNTIYSTYSPNYEATESSCEDTLDNDCDVDVDCDDSDCSAAPACTAVCSDGDTQPCPLQSGVCSGSQETCADGAWPGCDSATYFGHDSSYETTESSCDDTLDNDCDVDVDCDDPDCSANPACLPVGSPFYVSPSGGTLPHNGTTGHEYTLSEAKDFASQPENLGREITFQLADGNYGDVVFDDRISRNSWNEKATYKAETEHTAIFTRLTILRDCNRYLEFEGIRMEPTVDILAIEIASSDYLRFVNLEVHGIWDEETYGSGEWGDSRLYDSLSFGMYIREGPYLMNDIIIEDSTFTNLKGGIAFANNVGTGCKIVNNTFSRLAASAISLVIDNIGENGHVLIEGNHIFNQDQAYTGIDMSHGSGIALRTGNVTIRNNVIHNFGATRGIHTYLGSFPETGYSDVLIENNLVYDTPVYAVEFRDIGNNFVVRNNTFVGFSVDTTTLGVRYYVSLMISFASQVEDGSGFSLYNNVLVGRLDVPEGANDQHYFDTINEGNNIIWSVYGDNGVYGGHGWSVHLPAGSTSKIIAGRYETLHGYSEDYFEGSGNFFAGGTEFDLYSYTRPDGDRHGVNLNNAYKLAQNSEAIGFADTTHAPETDIEGNLRDASPDAGAYEFQGTACVDTPALLNYISKWKQGQMTMLALMQRIAQWKAGTGCSN